MSRALKIGLPVALVGVVVLTITVFVSMMSPLAALSSPFRFLVTVREVPELLRMSAGLNEVDPARLTEALRSLSASQNLKPDEDESDPVDPHYRETSLSDSHGAQLSVINTSEEYYVRVLLSDAPTDTAPKLAVAVKQALVLLGFREVGK